MSKPYDFCPPTRPLTDLESGERMLRLNWTSSLKRTAQGVGVLPAEFCAEQGRAVQLVDVREKEELIGALGHVPGSTWAPLSEVERIAGEVFDDTLIVMICSDGTRAAEAALRLHALGMDWVAVMEGGMCAWKDKGYSTSRDPAIFARTAMEAPSAPAAERGKGPLRQTEIAEHVGDPRTVRWAKMASFLLHGKTSCVDGRDDHGVVGTPGGDSGEFLLTLASAELLTGRPVPDHRVASLLARWVDAFGHFYMHSDTQALDNHIDALRADPRIDEGLLPLRTDPPQAWRRFMAHPPEALRPFILDHLCEPGQIGCGHLRFMLTDSAAYEVRPELVRAFLKAYFTTRWQGRPELEFVPLGGGHREGAVVNVTVDEEILPFTQIPLISPSVRGMQIFVNHPDVTAYQRSLYARFVCEHFAIGLGRTDAPRLAEELIRLGGKQLTQTLSRLASGLPLFTVKFQKDRSAVVAAS